MPSFVIAIIVVFGGLWFIRKSAKLQPAQARQFGKKTLGAALLGLSGLLALRGALSYAAIAFTLGLSLFGLAGAHDVLATRQKSRGQKSTVKTSLLHMELDHDTGQMTGLVLRPPWQGRQLAQLAPQELQAFYRMCAEARDQSLNLLEAWLDRNQPQWREAWQQSDSNNRDTGRMSRSEALAILGLKSGASAQDIKSAHHRLMKNFHPDLGGSDYLAQQINRAKDTLL